jgi:energy-coupling factor transporter ATP-binding protein EcfA2
MNVEIHNVCSDFNSYRAARVKSLFNAESGCNFDLVADLPIEDEPWRLGVIVGPSGSGKTSMGKMALGPENFYDPTWPDDKPLVDAIAPVGDFNDVTGALAAVGLGSVPAWLRPYSVLSNGEKFRANLARVICEAPKQVVIDEFTSVVDRQIAKFGALAFAKAWKRTGNQCILLSCHYDVLEWLEPDWVYDLGKQTFSKERLRRPRFELEIRQVDSSYWHLFESHYYLSLPMPVAAKYYIGLVDGEPVCHLAMATINAGKGQFEGRGTRLVVMPEWQGAGIGIRFLDAVCEMWRQGQNRWNKPVTTIFHTSHPGLCAALRRNPAWRQVSAALCGANKKKSIGALAKSRAIRPDASAVKATTTGYGGHFRAIQGFRYYGT